ncbi:hypothetical protein ACH4PU_32490 [Streptomyces sp. NPDC021100]|uniref:hypothetical protein n=1 Tax=Streptomyces sp. NPDC021100 TaxID=3365114 RepID=UPI0037B2A66D
MTSSESHAPRNAQLAYWKQRSGRSYRELSGDIGRTLDALGRREPPPCHSRIAHWIRDGECPEAPMPDVVALTFTELCRLAVPLSPEDLGFGPCGYQCLGTHPTAAQHTPPDEAGDDPTKRRTALNLITGAVLVPALAPDTASAATFRAFASHATATDITRDDINTLDIAVHQLAASYSAQPPAQLWPTAYNHRRRAHTLLHHRRHTLKEGVELARNCAMLSVILAWIAHDRGRPDYVTALCDDAWAHAEQADTPEIGAWAEDVRCTDALYSDRPLDALTAATRGLQVAPNNGDAAVRLIAQLARTHARLGNHDAFAEAAAKAHHYRDHLPLYGSGLFSVDAARIISYDATSHGALGQHALARKAATEAISHYQKSPQQAPTRLAIARLDLAQAHAALGEPDAAVAAARQALAGGRVVSSMRGRARQLDHHLRRRYPTLPEVLTFSHELRVLA